MITFGDPRLPARFWAKVHVAESGCWEWTGACNSKGYGCTRVGGRTGKTVSTHRLVLLVTTDIPADKQVDHLCKNKPCCNPAHLEIVTQAVNMQRAMRRIFCERGHRMAGDNIRTTKRGRRVCVTCARAWNRESAARVKARTPSLTLTEAATELRVSKRTVEQLTARGDLEVVRIGRRVLIRPEAIEAYVKSRIDPAIAAPRRRRSA